MGEICQSRKRHWKPEPAFPLTPYRQIRPGQPDGDRRRKPYFDSGTPSTLARFASRFVGAGDAPRLSLVTLKCPWVRRLLALWHNATTSYPLCLSVKVRP